MNNQAPIIDCKNLTKSYGAAPALAGMNLELGRGKIVGLLGPNGSGKTTLIKLASGLLTPSSGSILINGMVPGEETKKIVSYLPERTYFSSWMKVQDMIDMLSDFYVDFDKQKAYEMLQRLSISPGSKIKTLSKGNREKVQLIMVMSRKAQLYLLDEPIGGVDPAARDYILDTIITNYNEDATVLLSTHLIWDIERVLDEVIFIGGGRVLMHTTADDIRENHGKSVDEMFREVFRC